MAEINNLESIKENFEKITDLLNSIRAQGVLNTSGIDKVLSNISTKLNELSEDENPELIKAFLAELKRNMEEKYGFITAKFADLESSYNSLSKDKDNVLKSEDVKEFFDIIATNLNVFSKEVVSQKDLLTEITLRIEALRSDDSDKKDILRNIAVLKTDLEHFNNGFESIVVNLNNNFRNILSGLDNLNNQENFEQYGKDIENLYMTSNAILSAIQIIDQKNESLNEKLTKVITESDFKSVSKEIIEQNKELNYLVTGLANKDEILDLVQKIDTSIGIISGLKTVLTESGDKSHGELLHTLNKLEDTVKKILSEEEFDKFRAELSKLVSEVTHGTNLMRGDLLETNAEIRNLVSLLNTIDIKANFQYVNSVLDKKEEHLTATLESLSDKLLQSGEFNTSRAVSKTDEIYANLTDRLSLSDEKVNETYMEFKTSLKSDISSLQAFMETISAGLSGKSQDIATSIIEQTENIERKISEVDFNMEKFSKLNLDTLESQIYELKNSLKVSDEEMSSEVYLKLDKVINLTESLSASLITAFGEADTSSKRTLEQNHLETKNILDQNSEDIRKLVDDAHTLGTALSFTEASVKQKIEEEMGSARDIVEKTSYDTSIAINSFADSFEVLKRDVSDLRQDVHVTTENVREVVNNLPETLVSDYAEVNKIGREIIEQKYNEINYSMLKNETELRQISQNTVDLSQEIKSAQNSLDNKISDEFAETKELISKNENNTVNSIEVVSKNLEEIGTNFENLYQNIIISNSDIAEKVSTLPETLTSEAKEFNNSNLEILKRSDENIQKLLEDVHTVTSSFSIFDVSIKQKFEDEISLTKDMLRELSENSTGTINSVISELNNKLSAIEDTALSSFRDNDETLIRVKETLVDYIDKVKSVTDETNEKLTASASEVSDIRAELATVYGELRLLNIKDKENEIQQNVQSSFENVFTRLDAISELIGPYDRNRTDFDFIERNLETIMSVLGDYGQKLENTELKESIKIVFERLELLKQQIQLTETDMEEILNSQNTTIINELSIVKDAITDFASISIPETLDNIKCELNLSVADLKNYICDNTDVASKTVESTINNRFEIISNRITDIENGIDDKRAVALNDLKNLLGNITSSLTDIMSYVSIEPQQIPENITDHLNKIERIVAENSFNYSETVKYAFDDTVSLINEKLAEYVDNNKVYINTLKSEIDENTAIIRGDLKNYSVKVQEIYNRFDNLDETFSTVVEGIKTEVIPVIEKNEEVKELIQINLNAVNTKIQNKSEDIEKLLLTGELKQATELKMQLSEVVSELTQAREAVKSELMERINSLQISSDNLFNNSTDNRDTIINRINEQFEQVKSEFEGLNNKLVGITCKISEESTAKLDTIQNNISDLHKKMSEMNVSINEGNQSYYETIKQKFDVLEEKFTGMDSLIDEDMTKQLALIQEEFMQFSNRLYEFSEKTTGDELGRFERVQEEFKQISNIMDKLGNELLKENSNQINSVKTEISSLIEDNTNGVKNDLVANSQQNVEKLSDKIENSVKTHSDNVLNEVFKTQDSLSDLTDKVSDTLKETSGILIGEVCSNATENNAVLTEKIETVVKTEINTAVEAFTDKADQNAFMLREKIDSSVKDGVQDILTEFSEKSHNNVSVITDTVDNALKTAGEDIINEVAQKSQNSISVLSSKFESVVKSNNDVITDNLVSNSKTNLAELKCEFEKLSQKVDVEGLISEMSKVLSCKLDENSEELKSFIDLKSTGDVDLSVQIDNLKSDVLDMFNEYGKSFKSMLSEITETIENSDNRGNDNTDITVKLDSLPERIDKTIDGLLLNYQTKIAELIKNCEPKNSNQNLEEILNSNVSHLITGFESMKESLCEDIFAKLEEFDISLQRQLKIMQKIDELAELSGESENRADTELLSKMQATLSKAEENLEKTQNHLETKITEEKENLYNSIAEKLADFDGKLSELRTNLSGNSSIEIEDIEKVFNTNISPLLSGLTARMEDLNSDLRLQSDKIQDLEYLPRINEIEDIFNMNVGSLITDFEKKLDKYENMGEIKEIVSGIKSDLTSQMLGFFDKISFVAEQEEIIDFVQDRSNELKSLMKKLDNSLDARFEDGYKGYAEELRELVKDFKDNSDFKVTLEDIKKQIKAIKTSDEKVDYNYSLQDIETDIAKLRLTLNRMSETSNYDSELEEISKSINGLSSTVDFIKTELPHNEVFEIKNEIERISEDLTSISTRTNKLILASDESNNTLRDNLSDFRLVIRDLDERTRDLANTANMERMDARIEQIGRMINSCITSDKVFSKAFEYIAEWIDGAGENLNFISDNMNKFDKMENVAETICEHVQFISEKVQTSDNIDEVKTLIQSIKSNDTDKNEMLGILEQKFESQQNRIDTLEDKINKLLDIVEASDNTQMTKKVNSIDKQLTKLNKSIERLTSYVDEE